MTTLTVNLVNAWPDPNIQVYAFITGLALDSSNALFLLSSDGHTPYFPTSPSSIGSSLAANCAIPLGGPQSTTTVTIPHLAGARLWFSIGRPITFALNPGPALVEPSVTNASDPNIGLEWDFAEFTFNEAQLFANISYVDFVCLPISLTLNTTDGGSQHVSGMPHGSRGTVCTQLQAQSQADGQPGWANLVVPAVIPEQGLFLRALSPNNGIITHPGSFSNYYEPYIASAWSRYASPSAPLTVATQAQWGNVSGNVTAGAGDGVLTFPNNITYTAPSTADVFSCSSGPFAPNSNIEQGAITARLAAACNRSTLLENATTPFSGEDPGAYYRNGVTNHYARIVHQNNLDGKGYAFPFDDVAPDGGPDQSGAVMGSPAAGGFTVAVGGIGAYA